MINVESVKRITNGLALFLSLVAGVACMTLPASEGSLTKATPAQKDSNSPAGKIEKIGEIPTRDEPCPDEFQFIDKENGWLSCGQKIWQTSDGGKNWNMIYEAHLDKYDPIGFYFINSKLGWSFSQHTLQRTEDGGHTWKKIRLPMKMGINSVRFLEDGRRGWVGGGKAFTFSPSMLEDSSVPWEDISGYYLAEGKAPRSIILYTEDGGSNWRQQSVPFILGIAIDKIYINEGKQIWATAHRNLYRLDENKWHKIDFTKSNCVNRALLLTTGLEPTYNPANITDIHFADSMHGWLLFENGYLAKSVDGGQTWCDLFDPDKPQGESHEPLRFKKIHFTDTENGWGLNRDKTLYQTKDGGATWVKLESEIKFLDMHILDARHGWAVATEGLFRIIP
jgi:photosystem II stability/assembly factor-like uncharacterized protein